jgi:polar amino acid transport system substrate-binding protein
MMPFLKVLFALVLVLPQLGANLAPTGTLRATFIANNPVQGRVDSAGATSGPAPDLARDLARRLGVPARITPLPAAGAVMESVITGKADIGFLAYEAARAEQVDFSAPYLMSGSAYAVRGDSSIRNSADVDRAGVTVGAVTGQSQEVWVREHIKSARINALPTVPENAVLAAMLLDGKVNAFAANRTRMEELARDFPAIRVLPDSFLNVGQAIVVAKGNRARLDDVNRFLAELRASGFVKASIDRAKLSGVEVATGNGAIVR